MDALVVDSFDWRRGLLFHSQAVHWLNQAKRSHLHNNGQTVRVPAYLQKAMEHVRDANDIFACSTVSRCPAVDVGCASCAR